MIRKKSAVLLSLVLLSFYQARGHFVRKCCPAGEQLAPEYRPDDDPEDDPIYEDTKVKCISPGQLSLLKEASTRQIQFQPSNTTSTIPKLPLLFPDNSPAPEGSFEVLVTSSTVCDGYKIDNPHHVKAIYTDGFVIDGSYERPYDCVDFVFNYSNVQPVGIFCNEEYRRACPEDRTCLEKCCRHGKLLVKGIDGLECQESNHSMWSSSSYEKLLGNQVQETISLFYKNYFEVCYTSSSEYEIQPNGSLYNPANKSFTNYFCLDNYVDIDKPWIEAREVVLTEPENCFRAREEVELGIFWVLHIVATCISLVSLCLTFLAYVLVPKYQNVKGKIVLVNVIFTSLLFGFLLLSHFTVYTDFVLDCSTTNSFCKFFSNYSCVVMGYIGYFLYIATFSWITILGFNFFWNISSGLQPYDSCYRSDSSYGFPIQIATAPGNSTSSHIRLLYFFCNFFPPGFLALILLLLLAQELLDLPWPDDDFATHRAALSALSSAIFWILALALDLIWTFTRDNAPAINSDNSSMRISSSVGLGFPLLLTSILASFHAFLPRYKGVAAEAPWYNVLNPRMGQQDRCFISLAEPSRILLLYHLPIFCIVLINVFFFSVIVRRIFYTKRNSIIRNQNQATNELLEQMVRNYYILKVENIPGQIKITTTFSFSNCYQKLVHYVVVIKLDSDQFHLLGSLLQTLPRLWHFLEPGACGHDSHGVLQPESSCAQLCHHHERLEPAQRPLHVSHLCLR